MQRSLALGLIVSLLGASVAMGQSPTEAPKPAPTDAVTGKPMLHDQPKKDSPAAGKGADTPSADDAAIKAWEEAAKPGPNHKLLHRFEGEWQADVKDLSSGQESNDKGTMTSKMVYGGRFLSMDYDGRFHGRFFHGGGMLGYNNVEKRFESTWVDSMGTALSFMTGSMSADNKVLTLTGEMTDPTAPGKKLLAKEVTTIKSRDSYIQEFFMGEKKVMEITYTRTKAGAKTDAKGGEKPAAK